MHLIRRGKVWYISWYENGRKERESTSCTDKKAADTYFRRKQRELADPTHHAANQATIDSAAKRFLLELDDETIADETRSMYSQKCRHLIRLLGDVHLSQIATAHVTAYTKARAEEGAKRNTIHKELVALRRLLRSAQRARELIVDPRAIIPKYSSGYEPTEQTVSDDDIWAVMAHLEPGRAAWIAFFVGTSARRKEARRSRSEDLGEEAIRLRGSKTESSHRVVPVLLMFKPWIDFVRKHADGAPPLLFRPWGNLRRDLHRACKRAGVPAFGPNQLRHTHATKLVRAGVPYELAAKMLGHRSTAMLQRVYGHLDAADVGFLIEHHIARVQYGSSKTAKRGITLQGR